MNAARDEEFLIFTLSNEYFALLAKCVSEVTKNLHVAALPKTPEWFAGITTFQGEIIPVVNLKRLWGNNNEQTSDEERKFIIINSAQSSLALQVDSICGVVSVPEWKSKSDFPSQSAEGLYNGKKLSLLDVESLVSLLEL